MKQTFTKYWGRITEKLELGLEEKWIYVHYTKGTFEKTACLLKNADNTSLDYLNGFFNENGVSEPMKKEVEKFFMDKQKMMDETNPWKEFVNFLMKTLSLNLTLGITIAVLVYFGYKIGGILDSRFSLYPLFTLVLTFTGIGLGVLSGYSMIHKHLKSAVGDGNDTKDNHHRSPSKMNQNNLKLFPIIDVSLEDVRKAIREFSESLPKGVYRTILIQDDNSIDFTQLASILGGIPSKKFYMSKETYDLFEENEKQIAAEMDIVQKAVDLYVKDHKQKPMLKFDPDHRVNYYQLLQEHYLKSPPEIQFYITDLDGLVTHIKPGKKLGNSS